RIEARLLVGRRCLQNLAQKSAGRTIFLVADQRGSAIEPCLQVLWRPGQHHIETIERERVVAGLESERNAIPAEPLIAGIHPRELFQATELLCQISRCRPGEWCGIHTIPDSPLSASAYPKRPSGHKTLTRTRLEPRNSLRSATEGLAP